MTRDQAVARIQQGLGFRSDREDECALMLQEAQRFFEQGKTLPWFLIEEGTLDLVYLTDPNIVALPTGFIREVEARTVYYENDDGELVAVTKKSWATAFDAYANEEAGTPEVYVLRASDIYFFPAATADFTYQFPFYKKAAVLENPSDENVWLEEAPELLIGEAGYRLSSDMRDERAMKMVFDPMRKQAWESVLRETIAREEAALKQAFGSDL